MNLLTESDLISQLLLEHIRNYSYWVQKTSSLVFLLLTSIFLLLTFLSQRSKSIYNEKSSSTSPGYQHNSSNNTAAIMSKF